MDLYDWLRAARRYNGNTKGPNSETYLHSLKLPTLLRNLYGAGIIFFETDIIRFIKYVEDRAPDDYDYRD